VLDWWIPKNSPATAFAFVDVSERRVWIFSCEELEKKKQQESKGNWHLYMHTSSDVKQRTDAKPVQVKEFEEFLLENHLGSLFSTSL
jgi:hypothetical protein